MSEQREFLHFIVDELRGADLFAAEVEFGIRNLELLGMAPGSDERVQMIRISSSVMIYSFATDIWPD